MILLTLFAFLAGVVTILSPCILPVLPIILSSSGKLHPLGVVIGFVSSFTFFTLFLSTVVRISGIPADLLRFLSVTIIAGFGLSLLVPQLQMLAEKLFFRMAGLIPHNTSKKGFWSGILIGMSLSLLWAPCVGPILASVISLAVTGTVNINSFIIMLAFSAGTSIPMFLIMAGGQNLLSRVPWLVKNTPKIQKAFGVVMILTSVGILFNADRRFQTFILANFPDYGVGLTKFENFTPVVKELQEIRNGSTLKEDILNPMINLLQTKKLHAPEIISGGKWFNLTSGGPLTIASLQGKVVLIDFWTYSCINCQRTLPYLKQWWAKYQDKGLLIIGVHSPEFEFEKNPKNVEKAIADFGIKYPVVQDNDFSTWRAYDNNYWPAKYFIDKDGYIRYSHFGEGDYDQNEQVIQQLLAEIGANNIPSGVNNPQYQIYSRTPETYLGSKRSVPSRNLKLKGEWRVTDEYAVPQRGSSLTYNFESKEVFLVMQPAGDNPAKVKVYVDGKMEYFGEDNKNGITTVDSARLYKLINLSTPGKHELRLEFEDGNAQLFAFTFG